MCAIYLCTIQGSIPFVQTPCPTKFKSWFLQEKNYFAITVIGLHVSFEIVSAEVEWWFYSFMSCLQTFILEYSELRKNVTKLWAHYLRSYFTLLIRIHCTVLDPNPSHFSNSLNSAESLSLGLTLTLHSGNFLFIIYPTRGRRSFEY